MSIREIVAKRSGRNWCLFLDRDGVINRQIVGDYVRSWQDFDWLPGVGSALRVLRDWAPHLVVVTNQQGVGKGLMSLGDVEAIHQRMQADLAEDGGQLDAFRVCPHLEGTMCPCRKPRPGLILEWLEQNPLCDPSLSIMVGDSQTDLELARNVAVVTGDCTSIHIGEHENLDAFADASFDTLWDFAIAIESSKG